MASKDDARIARPNRHTSAYGKVATKVTGTSEYQYWTGTNWSNWVKDSIGSMWNSSVRYEPHTQTFVLGFRPPTQWGTLVHRVYPKRYAYATKYGGFSYNVKGDAPHPSGMGVPATPYDYTSGYPNLRLGLSEASALQAANNIKNQSVDLGTMFGEMDETLGLLAETVRKFSEAYRYARKGKWSKAGRVIGYRGWKDYLPNAWLEYSYGWVPMFNDLYGLQEQLKKPIRSEGFLMSSTGVATANLSPYAAVVGHDPLRTTVDGFYTHLSKTRYYLRISDAKLYTASQLGMVNPMQLAWELLSLSFVADWFLPIGDFLESLTAHFGTSFVSGYEDRIVSYDIKVEGYWGSFSGGTKCAYDSKLLSFERRTLANVFTPPLLSPGSFLSNLPRAISAVALFRQRSR